jgi:hypothetical protein
MKRDIFRYIACLALALIFASGSLAAGQTYLYSQAEFTTGKVPSAEVTADFNGDGKPDLAVANRVDKSVSILLGRSHGYFQPHVQYPTAGSYSLTAGDFDGDGKTDLAVSAFDGPSVSILMGNGDGTFRSYTAFSAPRSNIVLTGDLNQDGKLDLATLNPASQSVSVLLGNGNGTFQAPVSYPTDQRGIGLIVGDFNGDGKPDLATSEAHFYDVTVTAVALLVGNGNGTFQPPKVYESNAFGSPESISSGDFNHDGKLDLVVGDLDRTAFVLILPGDGAGNFSTGDAFFTGTFGALSVAPSDLDGDGNLDLVVSAPDNGHDNYIAILMGNSDGTFQSAVNYGAGTTPVMAVVADFNHDGKKDLAFANSNCPLGHSCVNGSVSVLLGNGHGVFAPVKQYETGTGNSYIAASDFDSDGKPDIAVVSSLGTDVVILVNDSKGGFRPAANYFAGTGTGSVATADFDGDGKLDLAVTLGTNEIAILLNNGDGTFSTPVDYDAGTAPVAIVAGDFNGDGRPDLAFPNFNSFAESSVTVVLNRGDGTFGPPHSFAVGIGPVSAAVADLNGDGKLDLVVANNNNENFGTFSVLLGNGNGTFKEAKNYDTGGWAASSIACADMDGDGFPDVVVANASGDTDQDNLAVIRGNGNGTFQKPRTYSVPNFYPTAVTIADFNGDGNMDVAVSVDSSAFLVYFGKGSGALRPPMGYAAPFVRGLAVADFDGDGFPDVAATDTSPTTGSITLYSSGPSFLEKAAGARR